MEEGYTKARLDKRKLVTYKDMGEWNCVARITLLSSAPSMFETAMQTPPHSLFKSRL